MPGSYFGVGDCCSPSAAVSSAAVVLAGPEPEPEPGLGLVPATHVGLEPVAAFASPPTAAVAAESSSSCPDPVPGRLLSAASD